MTFFTLKKTKFMSVCLVFIDIIYTEHRRVLQF